MTKQTQQVLWSTRFAFILAAIGSAIGLGNVWKFPYITGENGGGAFILLYLACIALIGLPVLVAEITLGRRARQNPVSAMQFLAQEEGVTSGWRLLGWMGTFAGVLILSFYSVVAGWTIAYVIEAVSGSFTGLTGETSGALFGDLIGSWEEGLLWHTFFMLLVLFVVARGVRHGLERLVVILMPLLFGMLLVLAVYAAFAGDFLKGLGYMFNADFQALFQKCEGEACEFTAEPLLVAMGHAFFTLSLGMGAMMVYGSYLPKQASIMNSAIVIALADTLVALLAGIAIFPLVFANGLQLGAGPGLVFVTLPIAFGSMPAGLLFGAIFFVLLLFAAWTSAISISEPMIAWLTGKRGLSRVSASLLVIGVAWFVGIGSVLSFNLWSGETYQLFGKTFFDLKDYLASNILLPLGGLMIAIFIGWAAHRRLSEEELALQNPAVFGLWRWLVRYVAPLGIILVFLNAIGIF